MAHGAELAGKNDVAIEDGANGVADGFVEIVAFDENGEEARDRAFGEFAGALEDFWQELEGAWGIAFLTGRLTGCEADFALGHGKTGDGIDDEEYVLALVAEEFGDGKGDEAGAEAEGCGLVASGGDHDAALAAFGSKFVFEKAFYFAVAFANEGDDGDVGPVVFAHGAEKRAFADTGTAEDADALAFAAGEQAVDDTDAGDERLGDVFAGERTGWWSVEIVKRFWSDRGTTIHRLPKAVEDAAEELMADGDFARFGTGEDGSALGEAASIFEGHRENFAVAEADDLGADAAAGGEFDFTKVADGGGGAFTFEQHAGDVGDAATVLEKITFSQELLVAFDVEAAHDWLAWRMVEKWTC